MMMRCALSCFTLAALFALSVPALAQRSEADGAASAIVPAAGNAPEGVDTAATGRQVTLAQCYAAARANYPAARRYKLIARAEGYTLEQAARGLWPQVQVAAKAQVQSEVTELPFSPGGLSAMGVVPPSIPKDQYSAHVVLTQPLYDGGATRAEKAVARQQSLVQRSALDAELYALQQRVTQLYFGVLIAREQQRIYALTFHKLVEHIARCQARIEAGTARADEADALRVAQLQAQQAIESASATRRAYSAMLSSLTGLPEVAQADLAQPEESSTSARLAALPTDGAQRPEYALLDARRRLLETQRAQIAASLRPRLSLVLQGGVGRPALNMFERNFSPYGIAGLQAVWNLVPLYTARARRALLQTQGDDLVAQRDAFLYNVQIDAAAGRAEVERYSALLKHDDEIVALRQRLLEAAEARFEAGTCDATDLVQYTTDAQQAQIDRSLHRLQQQLAGYTLRDVLGE